MNMNQTRLESLIEVCVGVAIGWVIALITQLIVFPKFGINVTISEQLGISVIFTIVSIIRTYVVRRWFNAGIHKLIANSLKQLSKTP